MKKLFASILAISMVFSLCACGHEHTWVDATCTEPKTCSVCGETDGEALGHTWIDATCTEPKTCSVCGETDGKALGHTWVDATCTEPKTCSICGETDGEALGHTWVDATCTEPKTCSICGETDGEALGHKRGAWVTIKKATVGKEGIEQVKCTECGEVLNEASIPREKIVYKSGAFNFTRDEFVDLLKANLDSDILFYDSGELDPFGGHACGVGKYGETLGVLSFIENTYGKVTSIKVWGEESSVRTLTTFATLIFSYICGLDPLDLEKTNDIWDSLLQTNSCTMKGHKVTFKNEGGGYISFTITG